jgi:hypothetical protein
MTIVKRSASWRGGLNDDPDWTQQPKHEPMKENIAIVLRLMKFYSRKKKLLASAKKP